MDKQDQEILEHFIYSMARLNGMQLSDVGVCICDREKVLMYKPAKTLDLKVTVGDSIKPGSALYRAIHENKRVVVRMDASLYGVPYIGVGSPILNERGQVIGAITISESTFRYEALKSISEQVSKNIEIIASTAQEVSAQTEEIAAASRTLTGTVDQSKARVKETDEVLGLIRTIANQTNLLGLNAAIEAARVGDLGRGFGVVAEEIRKLAATTTDSVKNIDGIIKSIQSDSDATQKQMYQIDAMLSQIAVAITQVAESTQQLNNMTQQLNGMADDLISKVN